MTEPRSLNVAVYQRVLMHYRVPLFNGISRRLGGRLQLIVGGMGEGVHSRALECEVHERSVVRLGPFVNARGLGQTLERIDTLVMPFDLQEIQSVWRTLRRRPPVILWGHSHGRRSYLKGIRRWLIRRSDAVVVYTQFGKDKLVKEGLDEGQIYVANNTLDIRNAGIDDSIERTSFLFSGRITKRKKVDEALIAFARLKGKMSPTIKFEIVGDGPEKEQLEKLVRNHDIADRVQFHGPVYDPGALRQIFQRSLAFVSPGHIGLGVLHSFAYGVPPLTRRVAKHAPESRHIVDNQNGLLFDGTIKDLATKMKSLADDPADLEFGKRGYFYFRQNCTLDGAIAGIVDALNHGDSRSTRQ